MGDPLGIGPEIICKALSDKRLQEAAGYRVFGSKAMLEDAARVSGITPYWRIGREGESQTSGLSVVDDAALGRVRGGESPGPTKEGGDASFRWVESAIEAASRPAGDPGRADAIVTAPISKTSWHLAGHAAWPGHTELLAERFRSPRSGMLFVGPHLRVMLATIHVPLARVPAVLTREHVLEAIELAHQSCIDMGIASPRIAVCGLNPHAGEGGILGQEDGQVIAPAVERAVARRIRATGPLPADTLFSAAAAPPFGKGMYDCVVAMYHDQGLIPVKLIDREKTVNVTVGLPTVRTSPAHGTAFDIAGKGVASAESMKAAIELAIQMVERRRAAQPK